MVKACAWFAVAVAVAVAAAGCKKGDGKSEGTPAGASPAPNLPSAEVARLLDAVPADAFAVATLASPRPLWAYVEDGLFPMDESVKGEFTAAVTRHIEAHLGLDPRQTRVVVAFGARVAEPHGALLVSNVSGEPKGGGDSYQGATLVTIDADDDLILAKKGDVLLFGKASAVKASIDRLDGKGEVLAGDLRAAVDRERETAYFVAAMDARAIPADKVPPPVRGIEVGVLRVGADAIRVQLRGQRSSLEAIGAMMSLGLGQAVKELEGAVTKSSDDALEGLGALIGYYHFKSLAAQLEPTFGDDTMTVELALPDEIGGTVVPMIGVVAAVAIPAFMKYLKKSKTGEARAVLGALVERGRAAQAAGSLPASAPATPPKGACCAAGETCAPDAALWSHPTWQALGFQMDDPHHYSYEFINAGETFTVRAYGDLDCDGMYSTFEMSSDSDEMVRENEIE